MKLASAVLLAVLVSPYVSSQENPLSPEQIEAVDGALDEAVQLLFDVKPLPVWTAQQVATLLAQWRGSAARETIERLAAAALDASPDEYRLNTASRFTAAVARFDPQRAVELWELWREGETDTLDKKDEAFLRQFLPVLAKRDPDLAVGFLRRHSRLIDNIGVYAELLASLLNTRDYERFAEVSSLARTAYLRQTPSWALARHYVSLMGWTRLAGGEQYREDLRIVVERTRGLEPPPDTTYQLSTNQGTVELTTVEYLLLARLENDAFPGLRDQPRGIEHLPGLSEKVEAVGGWEELRRWRHSEEVHEGKVLASRGGGGSQLDRERVLAINQMILSDPEQAPEDIATLSGQPETLEMLLTAAVSGPDIKPESRRRIYSMAREAVVGISDPVQRARLLNKLFRRRQGLPTDDEFAFWAREADRLGEGADAIGRAWKHDLIAVLGWVDPVTALIQVRNEKKDEERLELLVAAISSCVEHRRPNP